MSRHDSDSVNSTVSEAAVLRAALATNLAAGGGGVVTCVAPPTTPLRMLYTWEFQQQMGKPSSVLRTAAFLALFAAPAFANEWHVSIGATGSGSATAPFGRIQDAVNAAQPGDVIVIWPGTFSERISSVRGGAAQLPITLRARDGRGSVTVTAAGRVLTVAHPYVVVDSLVLDGQFGLDDLVRVASGATKFTLRNSEVRRTSYDAVDMGAVDDVLIEGSLIHHALNATGGQMDAHGIVAGPARRLTIRNTEIHTFSGDGFQIDAGRAAPGWDDVLIDGCRIWVQPLPVAVNGFAAGRVPGENAVDTKVNSALPRPSIVIRNTEVFGFRNGFIGNMAAFNIKENVDAVIDGVTVHSSEIAFRLRAPATVRVQNAVVHSVSFGVRYEENIQGLRFWNNTFGNGVTQPFYAASSSGSVLDVQNVAILGGTRPREAAAGSNLLLAAAAFVDAASHNYHLATNSPANDAGVALAEVPTDRDGTKRPQGTAYDVGAYERVVSSTTPEPGASAEIVLHAWRAPTIVGNWHVVADPSAAGGARIGSMDLVGKRASSVKQSSGDYFEMTFNAESGRPYRLWIRGIAERDSTANDSVYAQFTGAVNESGVPIFRLGTSSAATANLEDCSNCGLSGWGWQDNGSGTNVLGPAIYFATTGLQTIRVLVREDGFSIDQIVLSPAAYLTRAPGSVKQDTTILPETF